MSVKKTSKGNCAYCEREFSKGAISKHLIACPNRAKTIQKCETGVTANEILCHLRVQAMGLPSFWLDIEVRERASLGDLDHYLRGIWLECCGHMSQFSIGKWTDDELPMKRKIAQVLSGGCELTHIYDFGSSSETSIKLVAVRNGTATTKHQIALMARNKLPEVECLECQQPARWLCNECLIEEHRWGTLCDEHAENHPHEEYGEPVLIVNSPRMGICGYEGPAEPPY